MAQALPEPMNASPHHSKVKVTTTLSDPLFVAGGHVTGKIEMECRADRGLGIGIIMVELFAIQELSSRDHSATSTFLHCRRLFQGPGLPPSNAVQSHPTPGDPPLPRDYFQARRGRSTFLFRIPLPATSPSSISFGNGLAKVRYELRASVGVLYKNVRSLVVDKRSVDVVECFPMEDVVLGKVPEGIVVGEGGKLWMQGKVYGPVLVGGQSARLELQVKNHSSKKNTSLTLSLTRILYLPNPPSSSSTSRPAPVQISDTLVSIPYRGPEYTIPPGVEGVANLVFDVPSHARTVRGGTLDGDEEESVPANGKDGDGGPRHTESLFEIRCKVEVKLSMGMGSRDIVLEIPVELAHPKALSTVTAAAAPLQPVPPPPMLLHNHNPYAPGPGPYAAPYAPLHQPHLLPEGNYPDYTHIHHPAHPHLQQYPHHLQQHNQHQPYYPPALPYVDPAQNQVWLPPPPGHGAAGLQPALTGYGLGQGYAAPASPVQFDQFSGGGGGEQQYIQQQQQHPFGAQESQAYNLHNFPPGPHLEPQFQHSHPHPHPQLLDSGVHPHTHTQDPQLHYHPHAHDPVTNLHDPLVPHSHPHPHAHLQQQQQETTHVLPNQTHPGPNPLPDTGASGIPGLPPPSLGGLGGSGVGDGGGASALVRASLGLAAGAAVVADWGVPGPGEGGGQEYRHADGVAGWQAQVHAAAVGANATTASPALGGQRQELYPVSASPRTPPAAPLLLPVVPSSSSAAAGLPSTPPRRQKQQQQQQHQVHSPRPQLTPKHSFSRDIPLSPSGGGGDGSANVNVNILNSPGMMQRSKSERVEELEKMADVVVRHAQGEDLSGDLPKGRKVDEALAAVLDLDLDAGGGGKEKEKEKKTPMTTPRKKRSVNINLDLQSGPGADTDRNKDADEAADINKTLPGPPVPSGKPQDFALLASSSSAGPPPLPPSSSSSRPRADLYFNQPASSSSTNANANANAKEDEKDTKEKDSLSPNQLLGMIETSPLPKDQTPPTPALTALRQRPAQLQQQRQQQQQEKPLSSLLAELRTESGLDALERRLLEQVGTRKVVKDVKPDVRSVLLPGVGEEGVGKEKAKDRSTGEDGDGDVVGGKGGSSLLSSNAATGASSGGGGKAGREGLSAPASATASTSASAINKSSSGSMAMSLPPIDTALANLGPPKKIRLQPSTSSTSLRSSSSSKSKHRNTSRSHSPNPLSLDALDSSNGPHDRRRNTTTAIITTTTGTAPIPIPSKSPEPLNESAISSLTLAGRMAALDGDDSDGEFDGRTHKAGKAGGKSGGSSPLKAGMGGGGVGGEAMFDPGLVTSGLHMHMRQRAESGTPKTNDGFAGVEGRGSRGRDKDRDREDSGKEGKLSGKRKERSARADKKTEAKGRVAAWLGEIDIGVPPQEEIIPPSPSVARMMEAAAIFEPLDDDVEDHFAPPSPAPPAAPVPPRMSRSKTPTAGMDPRDRERSREREEETVDPVATIPNPRSSGFVPIATLNRETITASAYPIIARDATVVREARRVQDLWSADTDLPPKAEDKTASTTPKHPIPLHYAPPPRTQTVRTDRRVSPPSSKPTPSEGLKKQQPVMPMSYSAAAKNTWKPPVPSPSTKPASSTTLAPSPNTGPTSNSTSTPGVPRVVKPSGVTTALASNLTKSQPPPVPSKPTSTAAATAPPPLTKTPSFSGRLPVFPPPPRPVDDGPKYDNRSARGGRGGKVTAVASLWASGAIQNAEKEKEKRERERGGAMIDSGKHGANVMGVQKRLSVVEENGQLDKPVPAPAPAPAAAIPQKQKRASPSAVAPPAPPEKKLFSAALMSPAPQRPHPPPVNQAPVSPGQSRQQQQQSSASSNPNVGIAVAKWSDPQKRPDSRDLFSSSKPPPPKTSSGPSGAPSSARTNLNTAAASSSKHSSSSSAVPHKVPSATNLSTPSTPYQVPSSSKASRSSEALTRSRPGSVSPFAIHSKSPSPTKGYSSPASSEPRLLSAVTKASGALKPVIKGTSDPPVVSSSHATPMLSSTASLARPSQPHGIRSDLARPTVAKAAKADSPSSSTPASRAAAALKLPAMFSAPLLSSATSSTSDSARPASPSKPTDLAFGQGRLRDLIKKYQGGQKA